MKLKRKFILLIILLGCVIVFSLLTAENTEIISFYESYIFNPFQVVRGFLLNVLPFSIGDVCYVVGGAWLMFTVGKWISYLFRFKLNKLKLLASVLNVVNTALFVYVFFIVGWGANYNKEPLGETWGLKFNGDTLRLSEYDSVLTDKLNYLAPGYKSLTLNEVSNLSKFYYTTCTDSKVVSFGLKVKASFFSYFLERMAIEGYYNPFTGEGQVSNRLPAFMLPFVVTHEMAHQAGIAAEGDANLMAYALSTTIPDTTFNYSAQLNVWLYVHRRLMRKDSVKALRFEASLNSLTKAHIDTLNTLSKLYDNDISMYGSEMYDSYLKMQRQKDGIRSYGNVTVMAWRLEHKRQKGSMGLLHVP